MSFLAEFHFLRPQWLWILIPVLLIWWMLRRRHDRLRGWRGVVAPHLLPYLLVRSSVTTKRFRPLTLLLMLWLVAVVALAGPAWQRETSPFAREQSTLVIVLKMTPSMLAADIQPSRLIRAVDKIESLLERRPDTRAALIAYAGSAHRVLPFTRDHALILEFARELSPDIMPRPGDDLVAATTLGSQMIVKDGNPGSTVALVDSVESGQLSELSQATREGGVVELWAIAAGEEVIPLPGAPTAPPLDEANMEEVADALGGSLQLISLDESDVEAIDRQISRQLENVSADGDRWRDGGYYLLPLILILSLFWFRQGWVVRWVD